MLSRTADNLYWLARYVERADYLARVLDAAQRLATLPSVYGGQGSEWESALLSAGALEAFQEHYDVADEKNVTAFLAYDTRNPASIVNCIEYARTNARGVRTALTAESWDTINGGWLDLKRFASGGPALAMDRDTVRRFLDFAKKLSLDFDGSAYRTMLRNDAYWFLRLGHYMERADNTARLLDVKYHVLLPESEEVGGSLDYFQWTAILRAVSAMTSYHHVYRESVKPWLVADFLILKRAMPRSFLTCYENIVVFLDEIASSSGRQGPAQRHARAVMAGLEATSMKDIFDTGLHEFIENFLDDNNRLGTIIAEQYLLT